jgi:hypothetical protein
MGAKNAPPLERLRRNSITTDGNCWEWQGALTTKGYVNITVGRRTLKAHRLAYEILVGPIPDGLQIDHLCRNRACWNIGHLEAVSLQENIRRGNVGQNMRVKTECPQGHKYSPENTRINNGSRVCRACVRDYARRKRSAK